MAFVTGWTRLRQLRHLRQSPPIRGEVSQESQVSLSQRPRTGRPSLRQRPERPSCGRWCGVIADWPDEWEEVEAVALSDPEAALLSLRALSGRPAAPAARSAASAPDLRGLPRPATLRDRDGYRRCTAAPEALQPRPRHWPALRGSSPAARRPRPADGAGALALAYRAQKLMAKRRQPAANRNELRVIATRGEKRTQRCSPNSPMIRACGPWRGRGPSSRGRLESRP